MGIVFVTILVAGFIKRQLLWIQFEAIRFIYFRLKEAFIIKCVNRWQRCQFLSMWNRECFPNKAENCSSHPQAARRHLWNARCRRKEGEKKTRKKHEDNQHDAETQENIHTARIKTSLSDSLNKKLTGMIAMVNNCISWQAKWIRTSERNLPRLLRSPNLEQWGIHQSWENQSHPRISLSRVSQRISLPHPSRQLL